MRARLTGVLLLLGAGCGPGLDGRTAVAARLDGLTEVTGFGSNPGALSLFVYEPAGLSAGAPLVVALHGCGQLASAYATTGWNTLADAHGFAVAYPQTTANSGCFDWFSAAQQARTGPQVSSVVQMVQHLVSTRGLDVARVYVTGLSAGGAMANVLLATASDVFAAGAPIAAVPFGCATNQLDAYTCISGPPDRAPATWGALVRQVSGSRPAPRVALWHGTADGTVHPGNLQEEVDQWADVNGIDVVADVTQTVGSATRRQYQNGAGLVRVEAWAVSGMGHGTPVDPANGCGSAGAFILDVGLCSSRYAAEFFGLLGSSDAGVGGGGGAVGGGGGAVGGGGGAVGGGGGAVGGGGGAVGGGGGAVGGGGGAVGGGGGAVGGGGGGTDEGGCGCSSTGSNALWLLALAWLRRLAG